MPDAPQFGTVGRMAHDDFQPAMPEGTPIVVLRRHPDPDYDLEVAFIDAETGAASTTALSESDVNFGG